MDKTKNTEVVKERIHSLYTINGDNPSTAVDFLEQRNGRDADPEYVGRFVRTDDGQGCFGVMPFSGTPLFWVGDVPTTGTTPDPRVEMHAKTIVDAPLVATNFYVSSDQDPSTMDDDEVPNLKTVNDMITQGGDPWLKPINTGAPGVAEPFGLTVYEAMGQMQPALSYVVTPDGKKLHKNDGTTIVKMKSNYPIVDPNSPTTEYKASWALADEKVEITGETEEEIEATWLPGNATEYGALGENSYFKNLSIPAYNKHIGNLKGTVFRIKQGTGATITQDAVAPHTYISSDVTINPMAPIVSVGQTEAQDALVEKATNVTINSNVSVGLDATGARKFVIKKVSTYRTDTFGVPIYTTNLEEELITIGSTPDSNGIMEFLSKIIMSIINVFKSVRQVNGEESNVVKIDPNGDLSAPPSCDLAADVTLWPSTPVVDSRTNTTVMAPTSLNVNTQTNVNLDTNRTFAIYDARGSLLEPQKLCEFVYDPTANGFWSMLCNIGQKILKGVEIASPIIGSVVKIAGMFANELPTTAVNSYITIDDAKKVNSDDEVVPDTDTMLKVKTHSTFDIANNKTFNIVSGSTSLVTVEAIDTYENLRIIEWISNVITKFKNSVDIIASTGTSILKVINDTTTTVATNANNILMAVSSGINDVMTITKGGILSLKLALITPDMKLFKRANEGEYPAFIFSIPIHTSAIIQYESDTSVITIANSVTFENKDPDSPEDFYCDFNMYACSPDQDTDDDVRAVATHQYVMDMANESFNYFLPLSVATGQAIPSISYPLTINYTSGNDSIQITGYNQTGGNSVQGRIIVYGSNADYIHLGMMRDVADANKYKVYIGGRRQAGTTWYTQLGSDTTVCVSTDLDTSLPEGLTSFFNKRGVATIKGKFLKRNLESISGHMVLRDTLVLRYTDGKEIVLGEYTTDVTKEMDLYYQSEEYKLDLVRQVA